MKPIRTDLRMWRSTETLHACCPPCRDTFTHSRMNVFLWIGPSWCWSTWAVSPAPKTFDTLIDGEKIATENISGKKAGHFVDVHYGEARSAGGAQGEAVLLCAHHFQKSEVRPPSLKFRWPWKLDILKKLNVQCSVLNVIEH
jgi:ribosomal protein L37AE/L43A